MTRRALILLVLGSALGVFFATFLKPQAAQGEEAPPELKAPPAKPSRACSEISRPIIEATKRVRPAVVQVLTYRRLRGGRLLYANSGSGFIISKQGHILTNHHVVKLGEVHVVELADGHRFDKVKVVGVDPRSDVAVLRILDLEGRDVPVATLGDSDALEVGEIVVAIGAPYNLNTSVSMGIVSATGRTGLLGTGTSEEFIQTDAALNSGNSGGPLINLDGQVVGINTAIQRAVERGAFGEQMSGGGSIGIGFAVPINLARTVALSLIEEGVAPRGRIGIYFNPRGDTLNQFTLKGMGIDAAGGIRVRGVEPGSPAAKAGLKVGDIVTGVDGRPLTDRRLLHARLAQAGPGGTVTLEVYTGPEKRTVKVQLAEGVIPSYGIEVETLTKEKAAALGLKNTTVGAVISRIREGSVAALLDKRNRLLPGDVIVRIDWWGNRRYIRDAQEFEQVMAELEARPPRFIELIIVTKEGAYRVRLAIPPGRS